MSGVLVIGDSMLDRYWHGAVDRISPEAPVPVMCRQREECRAGGAANVALNVAALGCHVTLATILGCDEAGNTLAELLPSEVTLRAIRGGRTTEKIRTVARQQQLLRIDIEDEVSDGAALELAGTEVDADLVVLSDYAKGALRYCRAIIAGATGLVLVDPKGIDFERYRGAWLLKPNAAEFAAVVGQATSPADVAERAQNLRTRLEVKHLLVTLGADGMTLFSDDGTTHFPAAAREVFDVCGAGDTVIAVLAATLASGLPIKKAVATANRAAGAVVGRFGVSVVRPEDLN